MTIARELHKFPHEVGRMPYSDAREFIDYLGGAVVPAPPSDTDMTPEDFGKLRSIAESANG
jgi:hypothetical protein